MFCPNCGTENVAAASFCQSCRKELRPRQSSPPPNYLVQAILVTIFCCLPAGVVSLVYAAQVNGKYEAGDNEGALRMSRGARLWAWISVGGAFAVVAAFVIIPQVVQFSE